MPELNQTQLLFVFYVYGLFLGKFDPVMGGLIVLLMVVLGWKNLTKLPAPNK